MNANMHLDEYKQVYVSAKKALHGYCLDINQSGEYVWIFGSLEHLEQIHTAIGALLEAERVKN